MKNDGLRLKNLYDKAVRALVAAVVGVVCTMTAEAQMLLSLDSCRAMALRNNKQLSIATMKQDVAKNLRRSARTKYLPHLSAVGTYQFTSEEVSLLSDGQKTSLANLGTNIMAPLQGQGAALQGTLQQFGQMLVQLGVPAESFQQMAGQLQQNMGQTMTSATGLLNTEGQKIVDALHTDTRNLFAGSVIVTQPVFLGGSLIALNKLADINEEMAANSTEASRQTVIYATDQAFWQVVSLKQKQQLAESYLAVVKKLDSDVQKMIDEGMATRSEGLSVNVKVNEAEMTLQKVNDGLALSKMLLCQMIGLPMDSDVEPYDEETRLMPLSAGEGSDYLQGGNTVKEVYPPIPHKDVQTEDLQDGGANRPELKMLQNVVDMSRQTTNILKAGNLPQVALMGGYAVSNPNVLNGFEKKFGGFWNVGVLVRIPLWNWGDVMYKVRASKSATAIANLEMEDVREKIQLQVNQSSLKVTEANKRLAMATASIERAEENLRMANVGFSEGVITATTVMEAQTAWLQAQSQLIDALIDVRLSEVDLQKALGVLR